MDVSIRVNPDRLIELDEEEAPGPAVARVGAQHRRGGCTGPGKEVEDEVITGGEGRDEVLDQVLRLGEGKGQALGREDGTLLLCGAHVPEYRDHVALSV